MKLLQENSRDYKSSDDQSAHNNNLRRLENIEKERKNTNDASNINKIHFCINDFIQNAHVSKSLVSGSV